MCSGRFSPFKLTCIWPQKCSDNQTKIWSSASLTHILCTNCFYREDHLCLGVWPKNELRVLVLNNRTVCSFLILSYICTQATWGILLLFVQNSKPEKLVETVIYCLQFGEKLAVDQEILFHRFWGFESLTYFSLEQKRDHTNLWLPAVLSN